MSGVFKEDPKSRHKKRGRRKIGDSVLDIRYSDSSDSERSNASSTPTTCKRVLTNEFNKLLAIDDHIQTSLDKVVSFQNLTDIGSNILQDDWTKKRDEKERNEEWYEKKDMKRDTRDMLMLRDEILYLKEKIDHKISQCDTHSQAYSEHVEKLEEELQNAACYSEDLKTQLDKLSTSTMFSKTKEEKSTGPAIQRFINKKADYEAPTFDTGIHKLEKYARINGIVDVEIELDSESSSEEEIKSEENTYSYDSTEKIEEKKRSDISTNETFIIEDKKDKDKKDKDKKDNSNSGEKIPTEIVYIESIEGVIISDIDPVRVELHEVNNYIAPPPPESTLIELRYSTLNRQDLASTPTRQYGADTIMLESGIEDGSGLLKEHKDDRSSNHTLTPSKLDDMTHCDQTSILSDEYSARLEDSDEEKKAQKRAKRQNKGSRFKSRAARGFLATLCSCWHN